MHLRVPSGTYLPWFGVSICACSVEVAGIRRPKTAVSTIRRRRVFILMRQATVDLREISGLKRNQKRRDSRIIPQAMSSLILSARRDE
jgi:hypothetical protein